MELAQGASAFTMLHWTAVPGTGDSQSVQCQPRPALVQITPPDERTQLTTTWTMSQACLRGRLDAGALSPGTGSDAVSVVDQRWECVGRCRSLAGP